MDTQKSDKDESATFETIAPEKDNAVRKEFEIGELKMKSLKKMNAQGMKRMVHRAIRNLPSENFNVLSRAS